MGKFERLGAVNGLRGIAVLGVFVVHTYAANVPYHTSPLAQVAGTGWYGVYLFFMLSGFVLYLPFVENPAPAVLKFYRARIKRLYPLMLISAFISIAFWGHMRAADSSLWIALLSVPTTLFFFSATHGIPGNGPFWSLAVEIYLSAALPLLIIAMRKFTPVRLALALVLGSALFKAGISAGILPSYPQAAVLLQSLADFVLGMALAHYWVTGRLVTVMRYPSTTFILSSIALIAVLISINDFRPSILPPDWRMLVWPVADLLLAAIVASALALPSGPLQSALTNAPLQIVGMMCYSIYVWHMPLLGAIGVGSINPVRMGLFTILDFALVFAFAALSYRFIEFPKRTLIDIFPLWRSSRPVAAKPQPAE